MNAAPTAVATTPTFQQQFQQFWFYAGPIGQLLYWAAIIIGVIFAIIYLKKYVDFIVGTVQAGVSDDVLESGAEKAVSVEEFVE